MALTLSSPHFPSPDSNKRTRFKEILQVYLAALLYKTKAITA